MTPTDHAFVRFHVWGCTTLILLALGAFAPAVIAGVYALGNAFYAIQRGKPV